VPPEIERLAAEKGQDYSMLVPAIGAVLRGC